MSKPQINGHAAKAKEPLFRMVKRDDLPKLQAVLVRALAVLGALVFGGLLILALGHNPVAVYADMIKGSLGSATVLKETVRIAVPLLITALADRKSVV